MAKDQFDTYGVETALQMDFQKLYSMLSDLGVKDVYVKALASNDNSKNQIYLCGNFAAINIIPVTTFDIFEPASNKSRLSSVSKLIRGGINFLWMTPAGQLAPAPGAKLILYPQYPEVRLSGFLQRSTVNVSEWMDVNKNGRASDRYLLLGIRDDGSVIGYLAVPGSAISKELGAASTGQQWDTLQKLGRPGGIKDSSRSILLSELARIYRNSPIRGKKLNGKTNRIEPYKAVNGAGYTLEAELGISPNGYGEPDFEGWEVKAHGASVVTLFTPEPDGGIYQSKGVIEFLANYGYEDRKGRADRINFGGIYRNNSLVARTGLTLKMTGYAQEGGLFDPSGSIALVDNSDTVAAEWSYKKLLEHWNRKHAKAVYVTYSRAEDSGAYWYSYNPEVHLGEGTDFAHLLACLAGETVYLDPGIKMENASGNAKVKKRNQFRIKANELSGLYDRWEAIDLAEY